MAQLSGLARRSHVAEKTAKQTTDIILYDQKVIVFKMESDVMLYVVGGAEENEVLLYRYGLGPCAHGLD
jgi:hypothetical protein